MKPRFQFGKVATIGQIRFQNLWLKSTGGNLVRKSAAAFCIASLASVAEGGQENDPASKNVQQGPTTRLQLRFDLTPIPEGDRPLGRPTMADPVTGFDPDALWRELNVSRDPNIERALAGDSATRNTDPWKGGSANAVFNF